MSINCNILSPLLKKTEPNFNNYLDRIYNEFKRYIIDNKLYFDQKEVKARIFPIDKTFGKCETFTHIISEEVKNSQFKMRCHKFERMERINWVEDLINNANCSQGCCSGIRVWSKRHKRNVFRTKLYLEQDQYCVVLEKKGSYYFLVTAFPVYREHTKNKLNNEYGRYLRDVARQQNGM